MLQRAARCLRGWRGKPDSQSESLFFNNYAVGNGGAIYNDGTLTVDRSTFSSNGAGSRRRRNLQFRHGDRQQQHVLQQRCLGRDWGGGAIDSTGTTTVYSSTFSENSSPAGTGAAVHVVTGTTYLYNSILANSSSGFDCDIDCGSVAGSYNLIEDDNCGFTDGAGGMILGDDPRLGSLVSVPAYFTLQNDSPALDAGNNSFAAGSVDEPGNARMYEYSMGRGHGQRHRADHRHGRIREPDQLPGRVAALRG